LRALTQHYGGRPIPAHLTLAPLLAGDTPSAAYYQNLEALWLLEQQAYGSAVARFAAAIRNGYPEARLGRAYALALNGQLDSAQVAVNTALAQGGEADLRRPAQLLRQVLSLNYTQQYAAASDTIKAQFLVLRGNSLYPESLLPHAASLTTPAPRTAALLAQLPRALQTSQVATAKDILSRFAPNSKQRTPNASAWNVLRAETYLRGNEVVALRQLLQTSYFAPTHQPYVLYYQAVLADRAQQTKQAQQFYTRLLREAPFVEPGILAAADFYARQRDYLAAYGVLQAALDYNPESITLLKGYILAAVAAGLGDYATASLNKLRPLLSPAEYATFHSLYDARRAAQAAAAVHWN